MKAARIASFGKPAALLIVDTDRPALARTSDVLVRVIDSGVNAIASSITAPSASRTPARSMFDLVGGETQTRGAVLAEIDALIESGRLVPLAVADRRRLDEIASVHADGEAGKSRGKTVLAISAA